MRSFHVHITEESLQARPQSMLKSGLCVGVRAQEESITWHVREASLAVPLASMWQPTKYPQGHRHLPYFTVRITTSVGVLLRKPLCLSCLLFVGSMRQTGLNA